MIKFEKDSFIITVKASSNPVETWVETYRELLDLLECTDTELTVDTKFNRVYNLLKEMLPEGKDINSPPSKGRCQK